MKFEMGKKGVLPWHLFGIIIVVTAIGLGMITMSFSKGFTMTAKYAALVDAAMEVKLEVTTGHLWLEEFLDGGSTKSFEEVVAHFSSAQWYVNAMLEGGMNSEGEFLPLEEKHLRFEMELVKRELAALLKLTSERHEHSSASVSDAERDKAYDEAFEGFILLTDHVESELQMQIRQELSEFRNFHYVMAAAALLIAAGLVLLFVRYERERLGHMETIYETQEHLKKLSNTDKLTGIANRRYFDDYLVDEFKRARREQKPLSLLMIDVDCFKQYNDRYGHVEGDACLHSVASALNEACRRPGDLVARYGGEEFAIVLPNTDNALKMGESICNVI